MVSSLSIELNNDQFLSFLRASDHLSNEFKRQNLSVYRPEGLYNVKKGEKEYYKLMWQYLKNISLANQTERKKKFKWSYIHQFKEWRRKYVNLYLIKITTPKKDEDLEKIIKNLEKDLDFDTISSFRSLVAFFSNIYIFSH